MAILLALHEASRTGAPRIGALIARELARDELVTAVVMKDGPLTPWLAEVLGPENLLVCRGDEFAFRKPFERRLEIAEEILAEEGADLVYANSLAASVFTLAAAKQKRKSILHVHEKSADMLNLLAHDVTKLETILAADAIVLAAREIGDDIAEVFRTRPREVLNFGIAVDVEAVRAAARDIAPAPLDARGAGFERGERLVVGMCGHASPRKGADIFLETAAAVPQCDFIWIGGWGPEETPDNDAYPAFVKRGLPNLFVTGAVDNPYPYMQQLDLFFLSSREDPNPVVIAEALVLGVPILCFSRSTAIADRLGRCAIVCYGLPNPEDAARVFGVCDPQRLRSASFRGASESFVAEYDLMAKMRNIRELVARLRGVEAAPAAVA
jgi:glycosyltransferase involved in cell wall biosynthesis